MKGSLHRMEESYAELEIPRSNFQRSFADAPENEAAPTPTEQSAASESFPQHFEKSLNRLNIYENRLCQFPCSRSLQSNERTGSSASITQP